MVNGHEGITMDQIDTIWVKCDDLSTPLGKFLQGVEVKGNKT